MKKPVKVSRTLDNSTWKGFWKNVKVQHPEYCPQTN